MRNMHQKLRIEIAVWVWIVRFYVPYLLREIPRMFAVKATSSATSGSDLQAAVCSETCGRVGGNGKDER